MQQVLRKHLKTDIVGTRETISNERIVGDILSKDELEIIINDFSDGEEAYEIYGLFFDFNEELSMINLDKFAVGLKDYIQEDEEPAKQITSILAKIEPYRAYTLYFED